MAEGVIADNWSLQEISHLLQVGLKPDKSKEIVFENDAHSYSLIPDAVIQTEALFDLITDIILRDEILVDKKYSSAWDDEDSPLQKVKECGVLRSFPFLKKPEELVDPRNRIVEHMCSTESLTKAHAENVSAWNDKTQQPHPLLATTLWGGAGMCARSFVYEKSYTPHPLRRRLFINSGFMFPAGDALHQLTSFLHDNAVKASRKIYGNDALYSGYVNLPSIPIKVIQESSAPEQLISVALQMRDEFLQLRGWLKLFQQALGTGDQNSILRFRRELDSVGNYVNQRLGCADKEKALSMEVGIGIFKLAKQGGTPVEMLKNQFGIRATLNKLIFGSNGVPEIKKYAKMFGEEKSSIGYDLEKHFTAC